LGLTLNPAALPADEKETIGPEAAWRKSKCPGPLPFLSLPKAYASVSC